MFDGDADRLEHLPIIRTKSGNISLLPDIVLYASSLPPLWIGSLSVSLVQARIRGHLLVCAITATDDYHLSLVDL
jgi:hypothetical protein